MNTKEFAISVSDCGDLYTWLVRADSLCEVQRYLLLTRRDDEIDPPFKMAFQATDLFPTGYNDTDLILSATPAMIDTAFKYYFTGGEGKQEGVAAQYWYSLYVIDLDMAAIGRTVVCNVPDPDLQKQLAAIEYHVL